MPELSDYVIVAQSLIRPGIAAQNNASAYFQKMPVCNTGCAWVKRVFILPLLNPTDLDISLCQTLLWRPLPAFYNMSLQAAWCLWFLLAGDKAKIGADAL